MGQVDTLLYTKQVTRRAPGVRRVQKYLSRLSAEDLQLLAFELTTEKASQEGSGLSGEEVCRLVRAEVERRHAEGTLETHA